MNIVKLQWMTQHPIEMLDQMNQDRWGLTVCNVGTFLTETGSAFRTLKTRRHWTPLEEWKLLPFLTLKAGE